MVGGGMRQAGILAAAGIYALNNNIERLAEDHDNATRLADALSQLSYCKLPAAPETNMVFVDMLNDTFTDLQSFLKDHQVTVGPQRWVLHRDVTGSDTDRVIELCQAFEQTFRQ